nr:AarF/ABC1/UbiB kinase family protein [candidate division Zixibacteria bacterium]
MLSIRKISVIGQRYRHFNRYKKILNVVIKYGFGDLIDRLKIEQYFKIGLKIVPEEQLHQIQNLTTAERVRKILEELGPTFVKLAQILSTRPDLIPLEYIAEFTKLQDRVPVFPYEEVVKVIENETGRKPEELFDKFEPEPYAAASIGQVHRAVMSDGEEVAVKVQRPGIVKTIEIDLEIMLHLAGLAEQHIKELEQFRPSRIVAEFARTIEKEIDYNTEATHMEHFARMFINDPTVYVPRVYRELTTERMLTMEYVEGIKVSEIEALRQAGYNLKEIAGRGAVLIMKQIFEYGFFHADPHPGNVFILDNNVICYLDFGMMGRISLMEREQFAELLMRVVNREEKKAAEIFLELTDYDEEPDRNLLERDLADLIDRFLYLPLNEIDTGKLLHQLLHVVSKHGLSLKPHLYLMMKAMGTVEGIGRRLDADFEIGGHAGPFVKKIQLNRLNPKRIVGDMMDSGMELLHLLREIPAELRTLVKQVRDGRAKIQFEHRGLDHMIASHEKISNRIVFAIVLAALIIGSSLIIHSDIPPRLGGIPVIGLFGFLVAGLMGFWLLISILRSGRM